MNDKHCLADCGRCCVAPLSGELVEDKTVVLPCQFEVPDGQLAYYVSTEAKALLILQGTIKKDYFFQRKTTNEQISHF